MPLTAFTEVLNEEFCGSVRYKVCSLERDPLRFCSAS